MGTWGYGPFSNDGILDELGGFSSVEDKIKSMKHIIEYTLKCAKYEYFDEPECDSYGVIAVLCDSFGVTHYSYREPLRIQEILKRTMSDKEIDYYFEELIEMLICVCGIPVKTRVKLLKDAITASIKFKDAHRPFVEEHERELIKVLNNGNELLKNIDKAKPIVISNKEIEKLMLIKDDVRSNIFVSNQADNSVRAEYIGCEHGGKRYRLYVGDELIANEVKESWYNKLAKEGKLIGTRKVIRAKVVSKVKVNGKITEYKIADKNGTIVVVDAKELKNRVRNGSMQLINYTLTSDNRLMPRKSN